MTVQLFTPGHGIFIRDDDGDYYPPYNPWNTGYEMTESERERFAPLPGASTGWTRAVTARWPVSTRRIETNEG